MSTRRTVPETAHGLVHDALSSIAGDAARVPRDAPLRAAVRPPPPHAAGETVSFDSNWDPEKVFREVSHGR